MIGKREENAGPTPRAPLEYSQMLLRFLDVQGTLTREKKLAYWNLFVVLALMSS